MVVKQCFLKLELGRRLKDYSQKPKDVELASGAIRLVTRIGARRVEGHPGADVVAAVEGGHHEIVVKKGRRERVSGEAAAHSERWEPHTEMKLHS